VALGSRLRLVRGGQVSSDPKQEFERNYRENYPMVYNYVFRRVADRSAAEDVTSEAFLRAARYFSRFDPERAKFSTWVISIARNCINDYFARSADSVPLDEISEGAYAQEEVGNDHVGNVELAEQLLAVLDDDERRLVYLKYYEERRNTEIAEILGMNASTVSTRLSRAMAKMRAVAS
jgi:RNA polymerase sigma-70 factor (ECF subfamily)